MTATPILLPQAPFLGESPLQAALRAGATPASLKEELGMRVVPHPQYPNLFIFTYSQIESPKMDPRVQAARGCVLDSANNWAYVARPFDRFFNWGEGISGVTPLPNPRNAVVYKKEDGSLANLWFYQGQWHMSTKGSPDAGGNVGDFPISFKDLFWRTWGELGYALPAAGCEGKTFTFELLCAENRVVCPQRSQRIVLLAVRDNLTGVEENPENYAHLYEVCGKFESITSLEGMRESFLNIPAAEFEGYVVAEYLPDGRVVRSKVKHPGYLALAHLKEGLTRKGLLDLKRQGEEGEVLALFPEATALFTEISDQYEALVANLENAWEQHKGLESQKDFALAIRNIPACNVLFTVRKSGGTIRYHLAQMSLDALAAHVLK